MGIIFNAKAKHLNDSFAAKLNNEETQHKSKLNQKILIGKMQNFKRQLDQENIAADSNSTS